MAKKKYLSYPRKPKATASVTTKENYIKKCKDIDKKNASIKSENLKSEKLTKTISGMKRKI